MARNLITRTVTGVEVTIKVVDTAQETIVEDKIVLNKTKALETPEGLKKAVAKALPEGKVLVSIVSKQEINRCYGLAITKFMELAHELDPVTRAALAAEETEEATEE